MASVHWTGGGAFTETTESDAAELLLFNTGATQERYSIQTLPIPPGSAPAAIRPGAPYESRREAAGLLRLAVAPPAQAGSRLVIRTSAFRFSGAPGEDQPLMVGANGTIARGLDLAVDAAGGTLLLPHPAGLVIAWLDRPGHEAEDLWGGAEGGQAAQPLTPPALLPLQGKAAAVRVELQSAEVLSLRAACPAVTRVRMAGMADEVALHPEGVDLDVYPPAGAAEIALRAVGGGELGGALEVTTTPVLAASEGLGPETLLPPSGAAAFSFHIGQEGKIGIGVRSGSDLVEATLYNEHGTAVGSGLVQMPSLKPGNYLLVLRNPPQGSTVRVRPALAGITPPGNGPPEEVVRRYLQMESAGAAAPAASEGRPQTGGD